MDAGADQGAARGAGFPLTATLSWPVWSKVKGQLAPTLALAAGITTLPDLQPTRLDEPDLVASVGQLAVLQQHREVNVVRLVTELEARGVPSPGGLSRVDWLRSLDPTLTVTQARAVVTCAVAFTQPRWQALADAVTGHEAEGSGAATEPDERANDNTDSIPGERVTVGKAAVVIDFHTRLKPVADPDELDEAVAHLSEHATGLRPEQLARLARELGDQVRPPKDADGLDDKRRRGRGLWFTEPNAAGMVGMTGTLDPEGAALIRSAIDPLSTPCPLVDEAGRKIEDDARPAHHRRMDALLEAVARGVSSPGAAPTTDKAKIVVTLDFDALRDWATHGAPPHGASGGSGPGDSSTNPATWRRTSGRSGAGGAGGWGRGGTCLSGDVLSPAVVRRLACDAGIIPVVLGSDSQPLDVGRQDRLVTRAMRTVLWLRDQGCSFPGCSIPAQWADAHHVRHWADGGPTATSNLALLCRRHHTYVHEKHLTATVTDTGVTWHTWQQWRTTPNTGPPEPPGALADVPEPSDPPNVTDRPDLLLRC